MTESVATAAPPPAAEVRRPTGATLAPVVAAVPIPPAEPARPRLASLDVFRGLTIAAMLLVNNPGAWAHIYPPLEHAAWNGWTPTDLIFPFFLFIVGVAMTFSFASQVARGTTRGAMLRKVVKRSAILFALGLALQAFPHYLDFSHLRIMGVLQRIAVAYLAGSAIVLFTGLRGQVAAAGALLIGYWALQTLVPVPGGFPGVLQPGMDLGAWIDRSVFGTQHLWSQSRTWDPEGLLSTLPAIATLLLGVFTGTWLHSGRSPEGKTAGLFLAGSAGLVLGLIWNPLFPINKSLWTSSYVLFTGGMACHVLAICYWIIDVKGYRSWARPFTVFGVNAIAAFFLSGLGARILNITRIPLGAPDGTPLHSVIFDNAFTPFASPVNASLAFAITYTLFWLAAMWLLYRRRVFIKV